MSAVSEALVLMAGTGSRLRVGENKIAKPLTPLLGRPLISYTLEMLASARIKTVLAVVGFESELLIPQVKHFAPRGLDVQFIENPDWQKQNGISVLSAREKLRAPFLLTMADHLFDSSIVDLVLRDSALDEINLAVDCKLETIFDMADAMKVETRGDRVIAIGKDLPNYDAVDTGMFICSPTLFDYLEAAKRDGDCSLADGARLAAADGRLRKIDIGDAWWQDVDTPEMLAAAEKHLRTREGNRGKD